MKEKVPATAIVPTTESTAELIRQPGLLKNRLPKTLCGIAGRL